MFKKFFKYSSNKLNAYTLFHYQIITHKRNKSVFIWGKKLTEIFSDYKHDINSPLKLKCNGIKHVAMGKAHVAVLNSDGDVFTAGSNLYGQLGNGTEEESNCLKKVEYLPKIKSIVCGEKHTMALSSCGQIFSWGFGSKIFTVGALGLGIKKNVLTPKKIVHAEKFKSIACGNIHSLALTESGQVYSWGNSDFGKLGILKGNFISDGFMTPQHVDYFTNMKVKNIFASNCFSGAITEKNELFMWGKNDKNQLGIENVNIDITSGETIPVKIHRCISDNKLNTNLKIKQIACSDWRCIALSLDNRIFQWGSMNVIPTETQLKFNSNIKTVACSFKGQYIVTESKKLIVWGKEESITNEPSTPKFFLNEKVIDIFASDMGCAAILE